MSEYSYNKKDIIQDKLFEDLDKWNIKLKHLNYLKKTIN